MTMEVQVISNQTHIPIAFQAVETLARDFINFHDVDYDEVAIHFVETAEICQLHADYFDDPSTTDCISFPMDEDDDDDDYAMMGDVFVCPETATNYVKENGGDVYKEITLYVVHGLLHILGYDDIEESDRQEMRDAEANYLLHVAEKSLWLHS